MSKKAAKPKLLSSGNQHEHVRYLEVNEGDALDVDQLSDWIRQAARLPGDPVF